MVAIKKTVFESQCGKTDRMFPAHEAIGEYDGVFGEAVRYVMNTDLCKAGLWRRFADAFVQRTDSDNHGWRGEYWGKMMRGACWVYSCTRDGVLYEILKSTVCDLLETQEADGTVSSYTSDARFHGWDLWARKYVLLGLQYFLEISTDRALNQRILQSMCRQTDVILKGIGHGAEKTEITQASESWGGVNACSILEPVVRLYNATGEKRYLDFARYIVASGGCAGGDLIELALEDRVAPFQYPETKAYETMSFFEGVIEYYRATGEEKYRQAAVRFGRQVMRTDLTVLGCSGCTHELFDHSTVRQTDTEYQGVMQETCVGVTWMKLCMQLLRLSGDPVFADCVEQSFYNLYLGSFNTHRIVSRSEKRGVLPPADALPVPQILPFDSYSPLTAGLRGRKVGGYQLMPDRSFYGCCACIGAAGVGLLPKGAVLHTERGLSVQFYIPGRVSLATPAQNRVTLLTETSYPLAGSVRIRIQTEAEERFPISFRIPAWSAQSRLSCNGIPVAVRQGYCTLERTWGPDDLVEIGLDMRVQAVFPPAGALHADHFVAFRYGVLMLAGDARLGRNPAEPVRVAVGPDGYVEEAEPADCAEIPDSRICLALRETDGKVLRLINYFSAGKTWDSASECAVWLPLPSCTRTEITRETRRATESQL